MNAMDNVPGEGSGNISPFGICQSHACPNNLGTILLKSEKVNPVTGQPHPVNTEDNVKGPPCMAIIVGPWQNPHPETMIGAVGETRHEAITFGSFLVCLYGGIIEPLNSGQPLLDRVMLGKLYESLSIEGLLEINTETLSPEKQEFYIESLNQRLDAMLLDELTSLGTLLTTPMQTRNFHNFLDKRIEVIKNNYIGQNVRFVPPNERDLLVGYYEIRHRDNALIMERFLDPVIQDGRHVTDIQNIMYLAYTSPNPYHDVLFRYLPNIKIGDFSVDAKSQEYRPWESAVYVSLTQEGALLDSFGGYSIFFHEIGHGIDDHMGRDGLPNSHSLTQTIRDDVWTKLRERVNKHVAVHDDVETILNALVVGSTLSDPVLEVVRFDVYDELTKDLNGFNNSTASDVYGGLTGNNVTAFAVFARGWGHEVIYWTERNEHAPSGEFFAQAFSDCVTQYTGRWESITNNFGNAPGQFESVIREATAP